MASSEAARLEGSKVLDSPVEGEYGAPFLDCGRDFETGGIVGHRHGRCISDLYASMARVTHHDPPIHSQK